MGPILTYLLADVPWAIHVHSKILGAGARELPMKANFNARLSRFRFEYLHPLVEGSSAR